MAWKLHAEMGLLLGWGRAILLQLAHPFVAAGVAEHTRFCAQPHGRLRRLRRTLGGMLALTFGPAEEAARAVREIEATHGRVCGRLPAAAGVFPAGMPYSARDPKLLLWVHATLLDSHLVAYELYIGRLPPEEQDRYCAESARIARQMGVPDQALPRSAAALRDYLGEMLASGEIAVTGTARSLARAIVLPPSPPPARPLLWLFHLPTVGLLPPGIREAYGFPWDSRHEAALRVSAACVRCLLPALPSPLRHWPAARAARARDRRRRALHRFPASRGEGVGGWKGGPGAL